SPRSPRAGGSHRCATAPPARRRPPRRARIRHIRPEGPDRNRRRSPTTRGPRTRAGAGAGRRRTTCTRGGCRARCASSYFRSGIQRGKSERTGNLPGPFDGYFLLRRWWRVLRRSLRCFFFDIRLRRFLTTEPTRTSLINWTRIGADYRAHTLPKILLTSPEDFTWCKYTQR